MKEQMPAGFREVWEHRPDGRALCALIHGELGCLMYLREPGDSGFSSRNPDYYGPAGATIDYYLTNGQRDDYPAAWALPLEVVERALQYFRETRERATFVEWHAD